MKGRKLSSSVGSLYSFAAALEGAKFRNSGWPAERGWPHERKCICTTERHAAVKGGVARVFLGMGDAHDILFSTRKVQVMKRLC